MHLNEEESGRVEQGVLAFYSLRARRTSECAQRIGSTTMTIGVIFAIAAFVIMLVVVPRQLGPSFLVALIILSIARIVAKRRATRVCAGILSESQMVQRVQEIKILPATVAERQLLLSITDELQAKYNYDLQDMVDRAMETSLARLSLIRDMHDGYYPEYAE